MLIPVTTYTGNITVKDEDVLDIHKAMGRPPIDNLDSVTNSAYSASDYLELHKQALKIVFEGLLVDISKPFRDLIATKKSEDLRDYLEEKAKEAVSVTITNSTITIPD